MVEFASPHSKLKLLLLRDFLLQGNFLNDDKKDVEALNKSNKAKQKSLILTIKLISVNSNTSLHNIFFFDSLILSTLLFNCLSIYYKYCTCNKGQLIKKVDTYNGIALRTMKNNEQKLIREPLNVLQLCNSLLEYTSS